MNAAEKTLKEISVSSFFLSQWTSLAAVPDIVPGQHATRFLYAKTNFSYRRGLMYSTRILSPTHPCTGIRRMQYAHKCPCSCNNACCNSGMARNCTPGVLRNFNHANGSCPLQILFIFFSQIKVQHCSCTRKFGQITPKLITHFGKQLPRFFLFTRINQPE